ncbi:MAG: hypothetical protein JXX29_23910 [Deltaproteobacteria bacterium]|nr:hypothetical protein [Deltaproteobacteria bacterium]MBN2674748.1 hypothetical protein [Deltaproteobacteria bacterium]
MGRLIKQQQLSMPPLRLAHADERLFSLIDAQREKAEFIADASQGVIHLSIEMAKRLVGDAVETHPEVLQRRYQEALALVSTLAPGVITVHPSQKEQAGLTRLAAENGFEVRANDAMNIVDCVVEAGGVRVDSTLDTALYLFQRALEGRR